MSQISDFPLELLKHIAGQLSGIQDIIRFSLVSHTFYAAVNSDQYVYRALFLHIYEPPRNPEGYDWKTSFRRRYARIPEDEVLREMILDARPLRAHPLSVSTSPNIKALSWIFANTDLPSSLETLLFPLKFLPKNAPETDNYRGTAQTMHSSITSLDTQESSRRRESTLFRLTPEILHRYSQKIEQISRAFMEQLAAPQMNSGFNVFGQRTRVKLEPYEMPNFWEGDGHASQIQRRWFGGYLHVPLGLWMQRLVLIDMRLSFSEDGRFTSQGNDVGPFSIHHGTIGKEDENGRRPISWIKDYGGYQWRYKGLLEYGQQIMLGVWGAPGPRETINMNSGYGIFMYWVVRDEAPPLSPRTPHEEIYRGLDS